MRDMLLESTTNITPFPQKLELDELKAAEKSEGADNPAFVSDGGKPVGNTFEEVGVERKLILHWIIRGSFKTEPFAHSSRTSWQSIISLSSLCLVGH